MINVMIVDDEECCLEELGNILHETIDCGICGEYKNGIDAIEAFNSSIPDIVIVDVLMPGMSGIELANYVKNNYPFVQIALMSENPSYAVEAFDLGVEGFILKPFKFKSVWDTLHRMKS